MSNRLGICAHLKATWQIKSYALILIIRLWLKHQTKFNLSIQYPFSGSWKDLLPFARLSRQTIVPKKRWVQKRDSWQYTMSVFKLSRIVNIWSVRMFRSYSRSTDLLVYSDVISAHKNEWKCVYSIHTTNLFPPLCNMYC